MPRDVLPTRFDLTLCRRVGRPGFPKALDTSMAIHARSVINPWTAPRLWLPHTEISSAASTTPFAATSLPCVDRPKLFSAPAPSQILKDSLTRTLPPSSSGQGSAKLHRPRYRRVGQGTYCALSGRPLSRFLTVSLPHRSKESMRLRLSPALPRHLTSCNRPSQPTIRP